MFVTSSPEFVAQSPLPLHQSPSPPLLSQIPNDIAQDLHTSTQPSTNQQHQFSSPKHSASQMPRGSPSQQSTTPGRTPVFEEEENLRIKLIRLQKNIGKLKD